MQALATPKNYHRQSSHAGSSEIADGPGHSAKPLDSDNRDRFINLLLTMAEERNTSVLFVSHDRSLARHFHHQLQLEQVPA